jgi:hypothetical protein
VSSIVLRGLGNTSDTLVLGGLGEGKEAPVIVTELACAMVNSAEFEIDPDQRVATMTTGCDMVNGARMSVRPLRLSAYTVITVATSSEASQTVITTTTPNGFDPGSTVLVTIAGHTGSTPDINGDWTATITGPSTFTIPVAVTTAGTGGTASVSGASLPPTDDLGWTTPDAAASPLWDLTVTIAGERIPNAAITSFPIELDCHGGFESCAISFASKRTRKWPSRAPIVVAYDGMHPFEGRLATQRHNAGTELGWSLEFVGDLNDLRNHRAFRRVCVDSDLDNWRTDQGPNTAANVFEVTAS